ncbi:MAG: PilT/PilU family type 4a pilus ATPase [Candidatus Omnitrophota bacterium]
MHIEEIFKLMIEKKASDLFCRSAANIHLRINGEVESFDDKILSAEDMQKFIEELATKEQIEKYKKCLDIDFAYYSEELSTRFRVSIFQQRNTPSLVVRHIPNKIDSFEELNLPAEVLKRLSCERRGLVLLTGSMGSGKSTTLASIIEYINQNLKRHVLTVEEPIEYTFSDKKSIVNQRDLGIDVSCYPTALKAFTLQSPDVILIGNIRDEETMKAALTAAETGVLVLSTLHTINAYQTIERIINFFPPHQHNQIRLQLSMLLKGVISLRLIPRIDVKARIPAYETMILTPTIGRLIREAKEYEIPRYIEEGELFGMQSFNQCLMKLIKEKKISPEVAMDFSDNKDDLSLALKGIKRQ